MTSCNAMNIRKLWLGCSDIQRAKHFTKEEWLRKGRQLLRESAAAEEQSPNGTTASNEGDGGISLSDASVLLVAKTLPKLEILDLENARRVSNRDQGA